MASKSNPKSKNKPIKKEHFEVVLEDMNDSIKLIAEGQMAFRQEVNRRFDDVDRRHVEFRDETRANFKTVFDYLAKMDDELQDIKKTLKQLDETKIDKSNFAALAERVARLETELEKYKTAALKK